jgi:hypothetical protein
LWFNPCIVNARKFLDFWKTKTGQFLLFALVVAIAGALYYGYRVSQPPPKKADPLNPREVATQPTTIHRNTQPFEVPASLPTVPAPPTGRAPAPPPPAPLPISLYNADPSERELSDTYAPYGRLIPCETIITIDSAKIETPIIGFVTEDLYHDGKLIIPAGAEVHGKAQTDRSRERIASQNQWYVVWRTSDRMNGAELAVEGLALDMERDYTSGTWALTDGSAGLRGDIIKTDNWAEIKLFAATFLGAAASGLQDTQETFNPITGASQQSPLTSPKNAALQATSAVITEYARQIADSIKRDGFYIRVPAGKQFYLYAMQTLDQELAKRGQSQIQETTTTPKKRTYP